MDPTNKILHLKEPAFILLMIVTLLSRQYKVYRKTVKVMFILLAFDIVALLSAGLFYNIDISSGFGYTRTLLFFSVFLAISSHSVNNILSLNYYVGLGLSCLILALYCIYITGVIDPNLIYLAAMEFDYTIMIANRSFLGIEQTMFFYKTMPFVFFALIYSLRHGRFIGSCIIFASIWVGGSRTPILCGLSIICYYLWSKGYFRFMRLLLAILAIVGMYMLLIQLTSVENQTEGDIIKIQTIEDFRQATSIIGHGPGVPFFSKARGEILTSTEMTYLEILYHYGYLLGFLLIFIFFKPVIELVREKSFDIKDFGIAYLLYLINAGTNPLLINSTGLYVFATVLVLVSKTKDCLIITKHNIYKI